MSSKHIVRGGSFDSDTIRVCSSFRAGSGRDSYYYYFVGLRLVRRKK